MLSRIVRIGLAGVLVLALAACATPPEKTVDPGPEPVPQESPAAGSRLAAGLYDMPDGTVQAVGTLERSDLEGGFWAVVGGTAAEGNADTVVAVIANGDEMADRFVALEGRTVMVLGTRVEGASVRMAGPEIDATSVEELSDTGGAAE